MRPERAGPSDRPLGSAADRPAAAPSREPVAEHAIGAFGSAVARPAAAPERLGVLGGTFDPVHLGHIASAKRVAEAFALQKVLLVLAARPPHKPAHEPAAVEQRLAMVRLAVRDEPSLEASTIEVERAGPSYTYDTLAALAARQPHDELFLILGIDAYREIGSWHRPGEILRLASIIVTTRPGDPWRATEHPPEIAALGGACYDPDIGGYRHESGHVIVGYELAGIDVSASEVRRHAGLGSSIDHLTGTRVAEYIREHHLYGAPKY